MKNIHIPKPCNENWETMSPQEKGRFCSVCNKCVIDFTQKQPEEIKQIFVERKDENICGRFYRNQLENIADRPNQLKKRFFRHIPSSFKNNKFTWAVFSLVLLLIGCSKPKEKVCVTTGLVVVEEDAIPANENFEIGEAIIEDDSVAKIRKKENDSLESGSPK